MTDLSRVPNSLKELITDLEKNKKEIEQQLGPAAALVKKHEAVNEQLKELYAIVDRLQPRKRRSKNVKAEAED